MTSSKLKIYDLPSDIIPAPVPCAVLLPPGYEAASEPLPLCLNLHGGGGSREALVAAQPLYDGMWDSGVLAPMVIASASTGEMSWYLDEPGGAQWETFIADKFLSHLRQEYHVRSDRDGTVMTGVSMGGHGTLKIAFARPDEFIAIAAMEAGIEPGFTRAQSPLRSRVYTMTATGKGDATLDRLLGSSADADLFAANSPAARLRDNAEAIKASGMSIYVECGDDDALNLQDGNEFLHRLLWDLDISHEYHLVKDADHLGPTMTPRMIEAYMFLSRALQNTGKIQTPPEMSAEGKVWLAWSQAGMKGTAPSFDLMTDEGIVVLRKLFDEGRRALGKEDPTMDRRYAVMPPTS